MNRYTSQRQLNVYLRTKNVSDTIKLTVKQFYSKLDAPRDP